MERTYCCEQNLDEPLAGTADQVDAWVLLEYRPTWKARAVEESRLGPAARGWLEHHLAALAASGLKGRPQLVRQPEIDSDEVRLLVGVPGALLRFSGRGYRFLDDVDLVEAVRRPERFQAEEAPQYFVCTNGQRDLCCARFGLPAYAALRERVGRRAWQITHLGGHRFAPNVLVLPQGALYGRVAPAAVDGLVDRVEAGQLAVEHLRGRTWYPPPVQAAEASSGRSDLAFAGLEGDDDHATVRFTADGETIAVRVGRSRKPVEVLKSCGDGERALVRPYRVD